MHISKTTGAASTTCWIASSLLSQLPEMIPRSFQTCNTSHTEVVTGVLFILDKQSTRQEAYSQSCI